MDERQLAGKKAKEYFRAIESFKSTLSIWKLVADTWRCLKYIWIWTFWCMKFTQFNRSVTVSKDSCTENMKIKRWQFFMTKCLPLINVLKQNRCLFMILTIGKFKIKFLNVWWRFILHDHMVKVLTVLSGVFWTL